jgi:hypothetical protein
MFFAMRPLIAGTWMLLVPKSPPVPAGRIPVTEKSTKTAKRSIAIVFQIPACKAEQIDSQKRLLLEPLEIIIATLSIEI